MERRFENVPRGTLSFLDFLKNVGLRDKMFHVEHGDS